MRLPSAKRLLSLAAFPILIAGILLGFFLFREGIWAVFATPTIMREWILRWGLVGPLLFVGLQTLQVVVFIIPGEVPQIAGGYLFGVPIGLLLSVLGIAIGSAISFWLGRLLGVPFIHALFPADQISRVEKLAGSPRSTMAFFLLFLIPGIPKDVLCYVAGLTSMRFTVFLLVSLIGRTPGILGSVIMGSAAAEKNWIFAGVVLVLSIVLFALGLVFRTRIESWIETVSAKMSKAKRSSH